MKRFLMSCVLALAACTGDDASGTPTGADVTGMWRTMVVNGPINGTVTMTLAQGQSVTGTGQFVSATEQQSLTINGTFTDPDINLTFVSGNGGQATFIGTLTTHDHMEGTHSATGIGQAPMTIDRIP